jgi:hypothetical protein
MSTIYPKQPGYSIYHDPSKVDFKKISSQLLEKKMFNEILPKKQINLPRQYDIPDIKTRDGKSLSYSQSTFVNHYETDIKEQFQPYWVKLDKQVLRFYGYFKESIVETKLENARIRSLIISYYLVDDTISISEERQNNSGIPQGPFLKRSKLRKNPSDYYNEKDLTVGCELNVYGKIVKLYDCDQYTREYYEKQGVAQGEKLSVPTDNYREKVQTVVIPKKDNLMKDYLEHRLGGGRIPSQKQFLENDRKVLKFYAKHYNLKYIIHYYLADDTVEIREVYIPNSGRDDFPLFLKRNKLPKQFSIKQPGELDTCEYYKEIDIEVYSC